MKKLFQHLKKQHFFYEKERRNVFFNSSEALHKAKQAIFAFHRDDQEGHKLLKEAENIFKDLEKIFKKDKHLRREGSYRAALEEYVEAKQFGRFLSWQSLGFIKEAEMDTDSYLAGFCDLTGELVRRAVNKAAAGDFKEVERVKKTIEEIMGELIKFSLTGYLRTKYDQAKHNLKKMEEIMYNLRIREK